MIVTFKFTYFKKYLIYLWFFSSLLIPGIATMSRGVLSVAYGLSLVYLFLGISIVAEIFMEAIEKITSKKVMVQIKQGNHTI